MSSGVSLPVLHALPLPAAISRSSLHSLSPSHVSCPIRTHHRDPFPHHDHIHSPFVRLYCQTVLVLDCTLFFNVKCMYIHVYVQVTLSGCDRECGRARKRFGGLNNRGRLSRINAYRKNLKKKSPLQRAWAWLHSDPQNT